MILSLTLAIAAPAAAYIGPGAGIPVIGSLFGLIATIFVAIGAIVFWPVRKVLKRRKRKAEAARAAEEQHQAPDA